jgi:hypothetical protein
MGAGGDARKKNFLGFVNYLLTFDMVSSNKFYKEKF